MTVNRFFYLTRVCCSQLSQYQITLPCSVCKTNTHLVCNIILVLGCILILNLFSCKNVYASICNCCSKLTFLCIIISHCTSANVKMLSPLPTQCFKANTHITGYRFWSTLGYRKIKSYVTKLQSPISWCFFYTSLSLDSRAAWSTSFVETPSFLYNNILMSTLHA